MLIYIGNDHGGYQLKRILVRRLDELGISVVDIGSASEQIVRYPYYAAKVAGAVSSGEADRGILICSTGIGMSILANRFKHVRASLCTDVYMARMTRRHNDSNLLCLGGKITDQHEALKILDAWLYEPYEGGRHDISLELIGQAEEMLCTPSLPSYEEMFPGEQR